jgi:hypothetical protein
MKDVGGKVGFITVRSSGIIDVIAPTSVQELVVEQT